MKKRILVASLALVLGLVACPDTTTPPQLPNTSWKVPDKRWNATFKGTTVYNDLDFRGTLVVEGSAEFVRAETAGGLTHTIKPVSGNFTLKGDFTRPQADCTVETIRGSGQIGLGKGEGGIVFLPNKNIDPTQVSYSGGGSSPLEYTITKSNCKNDIPPPIVIKYGWAWLLISFASAPEFFTTPDMSSFSGEYMVKGQTPPTLYKWNFTMTN